MTVAEKETPWNWCPKCEQTVDNDMRTGEWFDGSEGTCGGCDTVYEAVAYEGGHWALHDRQAACSVCGVPIGAEDEYSTGEDGGDPACANCLPHPI